MHVPLAPRSGDQTPTMPIDDPTASATAREPAPPSAVRLFALAAGLLAAYQTLRIFYVQPWLHASSPPDRWLAQYDCLLPALCGPERLRIHHAGVLLILLAIVAFTAALPGRWVFRDGPAAPALPGWVTRPRMVRLACLLFVLTGAEAILYQMVRMAFAGAAPQASVWLTGVLSVLLAAAVWESEDAALWSQTVAGLALAAGMALLLFGAGALVAGNPLTTLVTLPGLALLWLAMQRSRRPGVDLRLLDLTLSSGFAILFLVLAMSRATSWRITFVGDEWSFYLFAQHLMERSDIADILFDTHDSDGYHTVLASALQAWTMQATRNDVVGWRLSSVLPTAYAIPAVYFFALHMAGRTVAWLSSALLAGAHALIMFSLIPYNNVFALLALCLALAATVWALPSASVLRFVLIGVILGTGFLLHSLALLVTLPVGILLVVLTLPNWRRMLWTFATVCIGMTVAAAPLLLDFAHWQALLKATPVQSEVAAHTGVAAQITRNIVAGAFSFLTDPSYRNSHFVVGGRTDPLTATLLMMGVAATLGAIGASRFARGWLAAAVTTVIAVSAVQQYGYVAITRSFIFLPVFALFAGLGGAALAGLLAPFHPELRQGLLAVIAVAALGFNQFHIDYVSLPNSGDAYSEPGFAIRELQAAAAADQPTKVIVLDDRPETSRLQTIAAAYGVAAYLDVLALQEFIAGSETCRADAPSLVVLAPAKVAWANTVQPALEKCWGAADGETIADVGGRPVYTRYVTGGAQAALPAGAP